MSLRVRLIILAAAACSIGLFSLTKIPLGIPGEWTWNRIEHSSGVHALLGIFQATLFFAVFCLVAWAGSRQVEVATRKELAGWLFALIGAGFAWLHSVQDVPPSGSDAAKIPFVLYYPSSSGYFYKARFEIDDTSAFLRDYETIVRHGDVLHEGTHPPGLVVLFRGLIGLTEAAPSLAAMPEALMPASAREAFDFVRDRTAGTPRALTDEDRSVIWLAAMLTQLAAVSVVVPLFFLVRLTLDREAAWRIVCFWPLVPAVAIFIPKSDVLFSFLSSLLICLWMYAVRAASRRANGFSASLSSGLWPLSPPGGEGTGSALPGWLVPVPLLLGALAGGVGWVGLFCSLAFLPVGAIALLASVLLFRKPATQANAGTQSVRRRLKTHFVWSVKHHCLPVLGGTLTFVALTTVVAVVWDLNLPRVWQLNYANHGRFYEVSPRSCIGWLLVNPVELFLALGAPLSVMLICGCWRTASDSRASFRNRIQAAFDVKHAVPLAVATVWGLLWLTGKNSGEAARLWIPLMPMALWAGAATGKKSLGLSSATPENNSPADSETIREWLIVLVIQAAVCLATVFWVTGFMKEQAGVG